MSTLPLPESILLEIHQSLGCSGYPTAKKRKFADGQISLEAHKVMGVEVISSIFDALDLDFQTCLGALGRFVEFSNAYQYLRLHIWTFDADDPQILWMLLGYYFVPGLARQLGFWCFDKALDNGALGKKFWYLPELRVVGNQLEVYSPSAQVLDWLLDLSGGTVEEFAEQFGVVHKGSPENLLRSLYNWRNGVTPDVSTIRKYFSGDRPLGLKGVFAPDIKNSVAEQFDDALDFIRRKGLNADQLRLEIPLAQPGNLEEILKGHASVDDQAAFVELLARRYAIPSMRSIRQRLLIARLVQDGYKRLLKFLCPGVAPRCGDSQQNKLLQLFALYKLIYNLTVDAQIKFKNREEQAENKWFEEHLPLQYGSLLFLSILPSRRQVANLELARMLTRHFSDIQPGALLEDHFGLNEQLARPLIKRNAERAAAIEDELSAEKNLISRMKSSSPWRALQGEHRFWVVGQVAQHPHLSLRAKQAAVQRLRDLASTGGQMVQSNMLLLDHYLNRDPGRRPKDVRDQVNVLLKEAEASDGYELWRPVIMQYKAKHLLACNDFEGADKLFRQALDVGVERNYGPLRGQLARDCLAMAVANQRLIPENHEKYYREMLNGGIFEGNEVDGIEDTGRWVAEYFWNSLYAPYPDVERLEPVSVKETSDAMKLVIAGEQDKLHKWIETNKSKYNRPLRHVVGDSLLLSWIKQQSHFVKILPAVRDQLEVKDHEDVNKLGEMLVKWRQSIVFLAQKAPKQLNIVDFKRQTPLMLVAERGDSELVQAFLQAGANPDMQDWKGMTALHGAIKSRVNVCVDILLSYPCSLEKVTNDGRSPLHTAAWIANLHATKQLLRLAPELAWQKDSVGHTPLELVEHLIEEPLALKALEIELRRNGRRCATKDELLMTARLLESEIFESPG